MIDKENLSHVIKKSFDKISLLTLSHRADRQISMKQMLDYIGLEYNKDVSVVYGTTFPYNLPSFHQNHGHRVLCSFHQQIEPFYSK